MASQHLFKTMKERLTIMSVECNSEEYPINILEQPHEDQCRSVF